MSYVRTVLFRASPKFIRDMQDEEGTYVSEKTTSIIDQTYITLQGSCEAYIIVVYVTLWHHGF